MMEVSLHDLTRAYIRSDKTLTLKQSLSERNRQQLELLKKELAEEIITAVRARMKEENARYYSGKLAA
jgi:hypothetical protein